MEKAIMAILITVSIIVVQGGEFPIAKRSSTLKRTTTTSEADAMAVNECLGGGGNGGQMQRQLRSDVLNSYLIGLAKCVATVGRPRFGKRSYAEEAALARFIHAMKVVLEWYANKAREEGAPFEPLSFGLKHPPRLLYRDGSFYGITPESYPELKAVLQHQRELKQQQERLSLDHQDDNNNLDLLSLLKL